MVQQLQLSIGEEELQRLNDALENGVSSELRIMLNSLPPADSAHLLESSPPKLRSLLWRLIDRDQEGDVLQELSDDVRQFFLDRMNVAELKAILEGQDVDDIADLLQQMPDAITRKVLDSMDSQDRHRVEAVLVYAEDTAGGLMNTDTITIRPKQYRRCGFALPAQARRNPGDDRQPTGGEPQGRVYRSSSFDPVTDD